MLDSLSIQLLTHVPFLQVMTEGGLRCEVLLFSLTTGDDGGWSRDDGGRTDKDDLTYYNR